LDIACGSINKKFAMGLEEDFGRRRPHDGFVPFTDIHLIRGSGRPAKWDVPIPGSPALLAALHIRMLSKSLIMHPLQ
jgi:hypothetical protein